MTPRALLVLLLVSLGVGCGPKGLNAKLNNGERRSLDAETHLGKAEERLDAIDPRAARAELQEARELLAHEDVEYYPERTLIRERMAQLEARLPLVEKELAQRELDARVAKQGKRLEEALAAYETAYAVLEKKRDLEDDDVDEAEDALEELRETLMEGRPLERESPAYVAQSRSSHERVQKTAPKVKLASSLVHFREGPGQKSVSAKERLQRSRSLPKDEAMELWQDARAELTTCRQEGESLIEKAPEMATVPLKVGTAVRTPKAVVATCVSELRKLEKRIKAEVDRRTRQEARAAAKAAAASAKKKKKATTASAPAKGRNKKK